MPSKLLTVAEYRAMPRKRKPRVSTVNTETRRTNAPGPWEIRVPLRITGPNGSHGHYHAAAAKRRTERSATRAVLQVNHGTIPPALPLVVTITRLSAGTMDEDNLAAGCKSVRDGVSDWLGLKSDRTPGLTWRYAQERAPRGTYAVRVEIARAT
jgi:hypothetical protein